MTYLCLVYPIPSSGGHTSAQPVLCAVVLVDAWDLNGAIQRLANGLLRDGEMAIVHRLDAAVAPTANTINGETLMKYLCLVYSDETQLHSLPESPEDSECQAYAESVAETGRMLAAEALEPVSSATTVRMRGGEVTITDGPFAETKEQLAGFYLVDAQNLDEALEIAAGIPAARVGSVEVRPVRQLQV